MLRQKGTEVPFSGEYYSSDKEGVYSCVACGKSLFQSETKYHTGSGWPSFWDAVDEKAIALSDDNSHGMHRIEIQCANCESHLGHLFEDPTTPTGNYYCVNSAALDFKQKIPLRPSEGSGLR